MYRARRSFVATSLVALLAIAGVTAAIAADPASPPPPKIAFLANGIVPADALAAGPIAGQLGAPVYTTQQDALPAATAAALDAYDPQLVIVMGGPVAIGEAVVSQVAAATGLPVVDPAPTPSSGVVRAAGGDRFATATIVADLLAAYAPAYLPVDLKAVDADKLDGKDSSAFALKSDLGASGGDADTLDGKDSTAFLGKTQKAADSNTLDGKDSAAFVQTADIAIAAADTFVNTASSVAPDLFDISTSAGTLLLDFDISCASFSGTTDTRWGIDLELNGTTPWSGVVLFFPHGANTIVGDSASMSVAAEVPAGTHTVGYSASLSSGDGSLDCNIHARGQGLPVTGAAVSAVSTSAARSTQGATLR